MAATDVIVIGAGVIGSSVALELARSGRKVVVLDKGPGIGTGSTSASSAVIRYSYSTDDAILTAWEAGHRWRDWERYLGVADPDGLCRFVRTDMVIFRTDNYDGASMLARWDEIGIAYEVLDADDLAARFPWLDTGRYFPPKRVDDPAFADDADGRLTAIFQADGGFIDDPTLAARNLAHAARANGATFRLGTEVVAVDRTADGARVVGVSVAGGETIAADVVVNVAGPHSSHVNAMAGVTDDMTIRHRALRQEVFTVPAPTGAGLDDGGALVADLDVGQYFRPQPGGTLLVGGTEPECDPLHWVDDPDTNSPYPTVEGWETAMMRLARRVPSLGIPSQPSGIASMYDASDDWVPIYDRSSLDGFYMACGTSGNQFKNAPIAGEFMRSIIDAVEAGHDHDADPVRVRGEVTGRKIDLGAFSRRRSRATTTGTVMG